MGFWYNHGVGVKEFALGGVARSHGSQPAVAYGWWAGFLHNFVVPNAAWIARLIAVSELAIGIALILGIFTGFAALAGVSLNVIYMLSGVAGVNPVYATLGIVLILAWRNAGHLGLDRYALRGIGTPSHPGALVRRKLGRTDLTARGDLRPYGVPEAPITLEEWHQAIRGYGGTMTIDMTNESSAGPSPWERELYAHLSEHAEAERGLLEQYTTVAEQTPSKAFRYLVNLLIEEEIRHHRIFSELAESLKDEALAGGRNPTIPTLDFDSADRDAVVDATRQLLANEEKDARDLKQLKRTLRDVKDTSLWGLLVDLMERDTQKHIAILNFVRKHA